MVMNHSERHNWWRSRKKYLIILERCVRTMVINLAHDTILRYWYANKFDLSRNTTKEAVQSSNAT
jgi:hypothetical protein